MEFMKQLHYPLHYIKRNVFVQPINQPMASALHNKIPVQYHSRNLTKLYIINYIIH